MNAFWVILTGTFVAVSCGLLGCFLILRKMAMVGDAISHAVLPGIVLAYLAVGSRDPLPMLIGAAALGVLTTVLIEMFNKKARLQADASIGITFTWLFALGIILISLFAGQVDLDQECVLYGEIGWVPLESLGESSFPAIVPRTVWILGVLLLMIIAFIWGGFKGLYLTTFDPAFASAIGISVSFWHYALMSAVSVSTVLSFESVGAILVVAFLVVLPATAYLLTENLLRMLVITTVLGIICSILGYYLATWINGSISGAMTTVAGILFGLTFLFAPKNGLISKQLRKTEKFNPEGA